MSVSEDSKEKNKFLNTRAWEVPYVCDAVRHKERALDLYKTDERCAKRSKNICLCFLDDIIILGKTLSEHVANIETILQRLREHNL